MARRFGLLGGTDAGTGADQKGKTQLCLIESQIFYPITFPISIGPGSVSVILTLMASVSMKNGWARGLLSYAIIALVIVLMCLILYLFLSQGERIIRKIGNSGSIVAFFTFCVGVQIVVTGIAKLFNLHV
jgi:multiple antibiotic resistance protein